MIHHHVLRRLALLVTVILATSCASIMHSTTQDVGVSSSPSNAKVLVDHQPIGNTPTIAKLSRKDNHLVRIELEGYAPFEMNLTRKVSGWVWGNVVFGGLIGLAVDAISGGLYNLTPDQVASTMVRSSTENFSGTTLLGADISVLVVLKPDPTWQRVGTLVRDR